VLDWLKGKGKKSEKHAGEKRDTIRQDNNMPVDRDLESNLKAIEEALSYSPDLVIRMITPENSGCRLAIIYISGLADRDVIQTNIIKPLLEDLSLGKTGIRNSGNINKPIPIEKRIENSIITASELKEINTLNECLSAVLAGDTALFIDNVKKALIVKTPGWKTRNLEEPSMESSVNAPRDGFIETLEKNIAMIRRRIKDKDFSVIKMKLGRRSRNEIAVTFIKGIANSDMVKEVIQRISQIDTDQVIAAGVVQQFIEDNFLSPFPQMQYTERPDRVTAAVMEGRIAVLLDNTPFAIIIPASFSMFINSPEDYYDRWMYASALRTLRYLTMSISLFLPGFYVALISYNQGLIPSKLAIFIAATREGVPIPSLIEAILMEITLEILREAGIRLPRAVGQAVGIVGGLVIGEAAVRAGLVSPVYVLVVALTGIASFSVAQYSMGVSFRILRFVAIFSAGFLGLYGVILFFIVLTVHLAKLKSFGVNYLSPFVPYRPGDWKDFIFRFPIMAMKKRPEMLKTEDKKKQRG
jgi:spore germination protein